MRGLGGGGGVGALLLRGTGRPPRSVPPALGSEATGPGRRGERPRMSDVRLSTGSPTLERMEGRPAEPPKPSACRSLFGPVDHDALTRELRRHRRQMEEDGRRRWNFDFQRHRPLQGRYEWRPVPSDALPAFYSRPPRIGGAQRQEQHSGGPDGHRLGSAQGPRREEDAAPETEPAARRKRPASLEDSSVQNKRANRTEEDGSEDSPSVSSVEQTPKKSSPRRDQT